MVLVRLTLDFLFCANNSLKKSDFLMIQVSYDGCFAFIITPIITIFGVVRSVASRRDDAERSKAHQKNKSNPNQKYLRAKFGTRRVAHFLFFLLINFYLFLR
jgi:hypothetical protein